MRRVRAVLVLLTTALLLAGCSAIPMAGAVQPGQTTVPDDPNVVFRPNGPAEGASRLDIVRGFVQAASASPDYTVAREFLTADFAKRWRPNAGVLVHDDPWTPKQVADDRVRLTVPVSASVEADGSYTSGSARASLDFELVQVKGQWRIAGGPDGIVLAARLFQRVFERKTLRFFDQAGARLVPDQRWFPKRTSQDTPILRALLAGPSAPLTGVVSDSFPSGTTLAAPVSASGGVTTVDLTVPGATPSTSMTDRLQQQIARSLGTVGTAQLRLVVNGRVTPRAAQPATTAIDGLRPVVLAGDRFGALSERGVTEDPVFGKRVAALDPTAVTLSARQRIAAALTGKGVAVLVAAGAARIVDGRAGLVAPTLDQRGWVYSVPRGDPGGLVAHPAAGGSGVPVSGSIPVLSVSSIEVSPDGSRMLVLGQTGSGAAVFVAGIVRASDGKPIALASARWSIPTEGELPIAATWIDDESVALLADTEGQQTQTVTKQVVGGLPTSLERLANARAIVGATGQDDLRVLLATGDVLQLDSGLWQPEFTTTQKIQVLAVPR